jgi:quercetin dioxygenase-like cupin family protein
MEGEGRIQSRGEPIVTIRPGDVIFTPPDETHWHGAAFDHFMMHLSMTEGGANWGDHVTEAEYRGDERS